MDNERKVREIMSEQNKLRLFEDQPIRTAWDECFFHRRCSRGVNQPARSASCRKVLERHENPSKKEGRELPTKCSQLKIRSADGKRYKTDVADTE